MAPGSARIAGPVPASTVTITPTSGAMIHVVGRIVSPPVGSAKPKASNTALSALRQCETDEQADGGGDHADDERLGEHRAEHLPAVGADGPQQCRGPQALRDDDRERVVDAERGDEERHAGEHQQERAEEAEEVGIELVGRLVGEVALPVIASMPSGSTAAAAAASSAGSTPSAPARGGR